MVKQLEPEVRASLKIRMEGPAVRYHRIALQDLVLFGQQLQTAVDRVARVLLGQSTSAQPGRKPSEIKNSCALDFVALEPGSISLVCDLPMQSQRTLFGEDLGEQALTALVQGVQAIGDQQPSLPRGYDNGVLLALREGGKLLNHGIDRIEFDLRIQRGRWSSVYTPEVQARVVTRIRQPVENQRVIEGRLLMGDFRESQFRCRVHPPVGKAVLCMFDEEQREAILAALTRYVRVVGEATEADGEIQAFKVKDIETLDTDTDMERGDERSSSFFDLVTSLEALAAEQRVTPVTNFDALLGDFWPEEETADEFIATVREWRQERD